MIITTAKPRLQTPRPAQAVESPFPKSLTYQNKQLALANRIKSRIRALKYHYDRITLSDDFGYHNHSKQLSYALYLLDTSNFICNGCYDVAFRIFNQFPTSNDEHVKGLFGRVLKRRSKIEYNYDDCKRMLNFAKKSNKNVKKYQEMFDSADSNLKYYNAFKKKLRDECLAQRRSVLKKRLRYAIAAAAHDGWFMVFASLTADDDSIGYVFSENSTAWTDYIRSVDRAVGIRCHGLWKNALLARQRGEEFHRYFAVVELGSKRGRPHYHCIHMMKQLPDGCSDQHLKRN